MSKKQIKLVSLASALAALSGTAAVTTQPADATPTEPAREGMLADRSENAQPNVFMSAGKDLLGMIVTTGADGLVTADHYSHYSHSSHASHSSHSSHYSSR
jgi:hypothetical protein